MSPQRVCEVWGPLGAWVSSEQLQQVNPEFQGGHRDPALFPEGPFGCYVKNWGCAALQT